MIKLLSHDLPLIWIQPVLAEQYVDKLAELNPTGSRCG